MLWEAVSIISYFIECTVVCVFMRNLFTLKDRFEHKKILLYAAFLVAFIITIIYNHIPQIHMPIIILCIFMYSMLASIFFEGKMLYKTLAVISVYAALSAADIVSFSLESLFFKINVHQFTTELVPYISSFCFSKTLLILVLSLICRNKAMKNETIQLHYWFLLCVIPVVSFTSLFTILKFSLMIKPKGYIIILAGAASMGILVINASVFYIFEKIAESMRYQAQYYLMKQNMKAQYNQFREIEHIYETTRIFKHDLDKHLACISSLIEQQQYDEVRQFIDGFQKTVQLITIPILSGNPVIDTIINTKHSLAAQLGIQMQVSVCNTVDIAIEPIDLCAILSNLLDNAIESCSKISDTSIEKYLKVSIFNKNDGIVISVTNSIDHKPVMEEGNFITSKKDAINHGIGLKSARQSVEKYHGIFQTGFDDSQFSAVAFLQADTSVQLLQKNS